MKSCEEMYQEVQPLFEADNPAGTIGAMERLLQAYPEFAQAHYDLGALYFESGDALGGPASLDLTTEEVKPGESIDVSVDLVAPFETGTYQGNWKLRNVKGTGFGVGDSSKAFWVKINVVEGAGMMLDFLGEAESAAMIKKAVHIHLADGRIKTPDRGGKNTTSQIGDDIINIL